MDTFDQGRYGLDTDAKDSDDESEFEIPKKQDKGKGRARAIGRRQSGGFLARISLALCLKIRTRGESLAA